MRRNGVGVEAGAVAVAAVILIYLLMVKPVIGMADNGDYARIMGTVGFGYLDQAMEFQDKYFGYFIRQFGFTDVGLGGYVSSELVLVMYAKLISWVVLGGVFDMRALGSVYSVLFLIAAWLIIKYNKRDSAAANVIFAILFVVIFADVGYSAYYNSLFGEPVSFVFLLLTLGFAAALTQQEAPLKRTLAGFFVAALFLIAAKVQNAPIGILLSLLCLRFTALRNDFRWNRLVVWFSAILFLSSVAIYFSVPKEIKVINQYQTVFYGILKDSPDPAGDLRELGLPEELAVNAGTNYFDQAPIDQKDPILKETFYPNISHAKVALFYLKHPDRFVKKLQVAGSKSMFIRPYYLGNYEKTADKPYGAVSNAFSAWSGFKVKVLPNTLWFIALVYIAYYAVLLFQYLQAYRPWDKIYLEIFMGIGLLGLIQFVTPLIGDGEADLEKHLFGFNVCFDLMLLASAVWIVNKAVQMVRR